PAGSHTLRAFCAATGRDYADYGLPVPLETFVAYGDWFQRAEVPHLEELMVTDVTRAGENYQLTLSDGETTLARKVIVATGVQHFSHLPGTLAELPADVCTHTSAHSNLGVFADREVAVIGAGQSALESAALLHESGAKVTVLARASRVVWSGAPLPGQRTIRRRLREPESGLGSGWAIWFYSNQPELYRRLPAARRVQTARTALGPAGAHWLRSRVDGKVRTLVGHSLQWADPGPGGVQLRLRVKGAVNGAATSEITAEHVLVATGYRAALDRLTFLDARLRAAVRTLAGTPDVGPDFQSTARDLYFIGPAVAPTFGPVMRFVYGADFAARTVARALTAVPMPRSAVGSRR
ncbi:MAG: NAD(P)-binding domain-containing protein, partial [Pseudonocardiaceae bacterium]